VWGRLRAEPGRRDRGSMALEFAVVAPGLVLLLWLMISAGRVVDARSRVEGAARDAARAASINHDGDPWGAAETAMTTSLQSSGTSCRGGPAMTYGATAPNGGGGHAVPEPGDRVDVTVTCDVHVLLGDFSVTIRRTGSSVLDTFRGTT
jgi:Flp pilus assembly protein TadG